MKPMAKIVLLSLPLIACGGGSSAASPIARKVIDTWLFGEAGDG